MQLDRSIGQLLDILHAFNAITEKIGEYGEDLEQLLQAILALPVSMLNASYASILLLNEKQSQFHTVTTYGDFPFDLNLRAASDVSKLLKCPAVAGEELTFSQFVHDSEWTRLKPEEQGLLEKVLCSPLVIEQKISGVACVYGEDFDPGILESEVFCLWAHFASLAIEKSSLYNQIHKSLETAREELRQAQSQLIRSEKLSSLTEIAMSVAHTIRNPITVIGGLSRRIQKDLPEDDPKHLELEMILSEASRLENIVKEFKRFFAINQISFRRNDVNGLVEATADEFVSRYQAEPDFALKRLLWNEPLMCRMDPVLFKRCLMHLLDNAREASGNGIHITLATSQLDKDAIIDVTDSGKGMSPKEMDHAFDPFFTTKRQGAGMGLAFVHFVISEHSGRIELKSEKGGGTRFRIRIPLETS